MSVDYKELYSPKIVRMTCRYRELPKVTVYYLVITFVVATATESKTSYITITTQLTSNGYPLSEFTALSSFLVLEYANRWRLTSKDATADSFPLVHGQSVDWIPNVEYL